MKRKESILTNYYNDKLTKAQQGYEVKRPIDLHLPKYEKPKPFFTGYGFSVRPVPNVDVHGVGVYGRGNVNDRLNLSGSVNSASVFYPGGNKMFMNPRFEVGMKYKFQQGGLTKYQTKGEVEEKNKTSNDITWNDVKLGLGTAAGLGAAYASRNHPLVSSIPAVIKEGAYKPYFGSAALSLVEKASRPFAYLPIAKDYYKLAAEKIGSQSGSPERSIKGIINGLKDLKSGKFGSYTGSGLEDQPWFSDADKIGQNALRNYLYGDNTGFEESDVPYRNLGKYEKKYGTKFKTYKLLEDAKLKGGKPISISTFYPEIFKSSKYTDLFKDVPYDQMPAEIRKFIIENGSMSFGSDINPIGPSDIGGHMNYLDYDPVTNKVMATTQDIWKFSPKEYGERWGGWGAFGKQSLKQFLQDKPKLFRNPYEGLTSYLDKYNQILQARMMERAGTPFVQIDKRPIDFGIEEGKEFIPLNMDDIELTPEELEEINKQAGLAADAAADADAINKGAMVKPATTTQPKKVFPKKLTAAERLKAGMKNTKVVARPNILEVKPRTEIEGRVLKLPTNFKWLPKAGSFLKGILREVGKKEDGGMITDPMGQWKYPGMNTRIPGNNITMQDVPYPVLAKANNGMTKMMYPGQKYSFPGAEYVDEYPMMQNGGYFATGGKAEKICYDENGYRVPCADEAVPIEYTFDKNDPNLKKNAKIKDTELQYINGINTAIKAFNDNKGVLSEKQFNDSFSNIKTSDDFLDNLDKYGVDVPNARRVGIVNEKDRIMEYEDGVDFPVDKEYRFLDPSNMSYVFGPNQSVIGMTNSKREFYPISGNGYATKKEDLEFLKDQKGLYNYLQQKGFNQPKIMQKYGGGLEQYQTKGEVTDTNDKPYLPYRVDYTNPETGKHESKWYENEEASRYFFDHRGSELVGVQGVQGYYEKPPGKKKPLSSTEQQRLKDQAELKNTTKSFYNQWYNSPMHAEMLKESLRKPFGTGLFLNKRVNQKTQDRLNTINNEMDLNLQPLPQDGIFNMSSGAGYVNTGNPNLIQISPFSLLEDQKETSIHEGAHVTDLLSGIPRKDTKKMQRYADYNKTFNTGNEYFTEDPNSQEFKQYVGKDTEGRARIMNGKYILSEIGSQFGYDPFTQKLNKDQFYKAEELSPDFKKINNELRSIYSDDEILNLHNTLSKSNNSQQQTMAKHGGQLKQYQKAGEVSSKDTTPKQLSAAERLKAGMKYTTSVVRPKYSENRKSFIDNPIDYIVNAVSYNKERANNFLNETKETVSDYVEGAKKYISLLENEDKKNIQETNKEKIFKKPVNKSDVSFGYNEYGEVPDVDGKRKFAKFTYAFDNDSGGRYVLGNKVKEVTEGGAKKHFTNVRAVAHFLRDSDILPNQKFAPNEWTVHGGNKFISTSPGRAMTSIGFDRPDWYRTLYKPNPAKPDEYLVKYVKNKEITKPTEEKLKKEGWALDFTVSGQSKFSDVDWEGEGPSTKYSAKSKWLPLKNGDHINIPYKDKKGFSRFSGGSITYLFNEPKTGKRIGIDVSGSVNDMKAAGESLIEKYKLKPEQLEFVFHDMGSYSAKPKADKNNELDYNQWIDFNTYNRGFSGAPLMIPKEKNGGDISIPQLPKNNTPLLQFYYSRGGSKK
jgi:hypothetical protein